MYASLIFVFTSGCDKDAEPDMSEPPSAHGEFKDGFETETHTLEELFAADGSRWTAMQQQNPSPGINEISLTTLEASEGESALRIYAHPSDSTVSKMDIEKGGLEMYAADRITIRADFLIPGSQSLENLFLIDLECCSCWDSSVVENYGIENQCPGIRLKFAEGDYLSIERGKINGSTWSQTELAFPRDQWVSVEWELTLSDGSDGINKLSINGIEVINQSGMNMPNAEVFAALFADQGMEFNLPEPGVYERIQVGATANSSPGAVELYVDNFELTAR